MMKKSHALLIGNGEKLPVAFLRTLARQAQAVFAADGGAAQCARAHLTVQAVIGDLDSVSPALKKKWADKLVYIPTQQNTDLEKALRYLIKQGFTSCTLAGFWGGRADFSVGNLLALARFCPKIDLRVCSPGFTIYPLIKTTRLPSKKGKRVSLIALKNCKGVSLSGLTYPLKNASVPFGSTLTLSNTADADTFEVALRSGALLVYTEH